MARARAPQRPAPTPAEKARARRILERLLRRYPDPKLALHWENPYQLLVAVILSAQCTDERVNQVTPELFRRYPDPAALARADLRELEELVRPTGYYRSKARNLQACCRALVERFGGRVPEDPELLVQLPGVGRKTAHMVVGNAFGRPAVAVDTHVLRVSRRLGLAPPEADAEEVEEALEALFPRARWTQLSNALILHGRETCTARRPRCEACILRDLCPWPEKGPGGGGAKG
ncbi:MAG: endonuclease III [Gammaproteobacteria bacterium]|nr:MAG: endonuclease III [Gammaproteobacteria bacterium]